VKAIRIRVGSIQKIKGNWTLIEQYELDHDSKSIEANGSKAKR